MTARLAPRARQPPSSFPAGRRLESAFIMRRLLSLPLALMAIATATASRPVLQETPEYGPAKGTLVIVGLGGLEGSGILEKFLQLAGGWIAEAKPRNWST
jgi:hypothetical protein